MASFKALFINLVGFEWYRENSSGFINCVPFGRVISSKDVMFFVKSFWRNLLDVCSVSSGNMELSFVHMVSSGAGCKNNSVNVLTR